MPRRTGMPDWDTLGDLLADSYNKMTDHVHAREAVARHDGSWHSSDFQALLRRQDHTLALALETQMRVWGAFYTMAGRAAEGANSPQPSVDTNSPESGAQA